MQDIVKTNELYYKSKRTKSYNFSEYSLPIVFKRYTRRAEDKQSKFANKLKNIYEGIKSTK